MKVLFQRTDANSDLPLPERMTAGSAGMDLRACVEAELSLAPGERQAIPTGFRMALPAGHEGQVRPRSGLALRAGVTVMNAPGTIDADYRGEVKVILVNLGSKPFTVRRGDRIAQLVVAPVATFSTEEATDLEATDRGAGGFGHTGR